MAKSQVNCAYCKKDFLKENKFINQQTKLGQLNHFCNIKCLRAFAAEKTKPNVNCTECGALFFKKPSEIRKCASNFCSRSCSAKYNNKTRDKSFYKNMIERICPKCTKTYEWKVGTTKNTLCWDCRPINRSTRHLAKIHGVILKEYVPALVMIKCKKCEKEFEFLDKTGGTRKKLCTDCYALTQSERGREAGKKQNTNKRSKNEIKFAELCKSKFKVVLENPKMFNGWDADVVIEDIKVAVLWNGPWHYRKIKSNHSLGMVQNRDRIKLKEIAKAGYSAYIIRDDGNENNSFVESEFNKFVSSLI